MEHSKKKNDRVLLLQCKYIKVHSGQGALHSPGPPGHVLLRGKCGFLQTKKTAPFPLLGPPHAGANEGQDSPRLAPLCVLRVTSRPTEGTIPSGWVYLILSAVSVC